MHTHTHTILERMENNMLKCITHGRQLLTWLPQGKKGKGRCKM